jgi:hypothetical protein
MKTSLLLLQLFLFNLIFAQKIDVSFSSNFKDAILETSKLVMDCGENSKYHYFLFSSDENYLASKKIRLVAFRKDNSDYAFDYEIKGFNSNSPEYEKIVKPMILNEVKVYENTIYIIMTPTGSNTISFYVQSLSAELNLKKEITNVYEIPSYHFNKRNLTFLGDKSKTPDENLLILETTWDASTKKTIYKPHLLDPTLNLKKCPEVSFDYKEYYFGAFIYTPENVMRRYNYAQGELFFIYEDESKNNPIRSIVKLNIKTGEQSQLKLLVNHEIKMLSVEYGHDSLFIHGNAISQYNNQDLKFFLKTINVSNFEEVKTEEGSIKIPENYSEKSYYNFDRFITADNRTILCYQFYKTGTDLQITADVLSISSIYQDQISNDVIDLSPGMRAINKCSFINGNRSEFNLFYTLAGLSNDITPNICTIHNSTNYQVTDLAQLFQKEYSQYIITLKSNNFWACDNKIYFLAEKENQVFMGKITINSGQ